MNGSLLVKDIDDEFIYFQKSMSNDKRISSFLLEEGGIRSVDNLEARYTGYILFKYTDKTSKTLI